MTRSIRQTCLLKIKTFILCYSVIGTFIVVSASRWNPSSIMARKHDLLEMTPAIELSGLAHDIENRNDALHVTTQNLDDDRDGDDDHDHHVHHRHFHHPHHDSYQNSIEEVKSLLLTELRGGGGGRKEQLHDHDVESKKSSTLASVFNLVNNVAGAGILTLSAGMAPGTGWIPAIAICTILGLLSGHSFALIGDACELTGEGDFKGLWSKTIGAKSTYLVDSMIAILCLAVAVIYSGILGDVFTPLLAQAGLPDQWNGRTSNILAITSGLLLPLSLIKDLSALAFTSILGFSAIIYTVLFIVVRSLDGTYKVGSGKFAMDGLIAAQPAFERTSLWNFDFTSLVLASNLGLAYIAHYNGPTFYRSLRNANSKRFRSMVDIAFTVLIGLYIITMAAGYSTFGDSCLGNILLNYHPHDILSTLARLATGCSILFGFPLVLCGAREGIIGAAASFGKTGIGSDNNHFLVVAGLLAFVTTISCTVKDVSLVVGITGALLGSFVVYVCPGIIYARAVGTVKGWDSAEYKKASINLAFVPFGLLIASLGCYMTIKGSVS